MKCEYLGHRGAWCLESSSIALICPDLYAEKERICTYSSSCQLWCSVYKLLFLEFAAKNIRGHDAFYDFYHAHIDKLNAMVFLQRMQKAEQNLRSVYKCYFASYNGGRNVGNFSQFYSLSRRYRFAIKPKRVMDVQQIRRTTQAIFNFSFFPERRWFHPSIIPIH